jgi:hypothetical protein
MKTLALRNNDVTWTSTDDGSVVVLDLRTSCYLSLNDSGAMLWRTLADGVTTEDLVGLLAARYLISDAAAEADVSAFLDALRDRDLLDE